MIITYFGKQFFKIQKGDLTIALNPISKNSKLKIKPSRFGSDIAISTINHSDYNGFEMVSHGEVKPFEIKGPGDYEIKNIFIKGTMSETILDQKKYINSIYTFSFDNISICFLGVISKDKLNSITTEDLNNPDILFISLGNEELMTTTDAYNLAVKLEAKIIIPMDYNEKTLKDFLKDGSQEKVKSIDKLTIKNKDLVGHQAEIVVLSS